MVYNNNFIAVVKVGGKVLRESNEGVVRIPFGSEYSIFFKNKSFQRALVSIEINGEDALSENQIIVDANGTSTVEGFMDDFGKVTNKFKFIEKTAEISDFRGDDPEDGMIRITYQFEFVKPISSPFLNLPPINVTTKWNNGGYFHDYPQMIGSSSSRSFDNSFQANCCLKSYFTPLVSTVETDLSSDGLTVPGSASGQKFESTAVGILAPEKYVICFQLKGGDPISGRVHKPVYTTTKLQCQSCGKKSNSRFDFCPGCGTALKTFK